MNRKDNFMVARILVTVLLAALACARMTQAQPDGTRAYIVLGTSQIYKDDAANAGKHATADSLMSAIGLAVNDLMPTGQIVDQFAAIGRMILSRSDQFVLHYNVLAETRSDRELQLLVRVTVAFEKVRDALQRAGFVVDRMEMPRILFMISERSSIDDKVRYWWSGVESMTGSAEESMAEPFLARGYPMVRHSGFAPVDAGDGLPPDPDNAAAARIGRIFNADIVVAGTAVAEKTMNRMGEDLHSLKGVVQARAVKVETGEDLASATFSDIRLHAEEEKGIDLVIRAVATQTGDDLARRVSGVWLDRHREQPTQIRILVRGPSGLAHFVKLRERITALGGVKHVKVLELRADQAQLSVDFEFSARRLAKDLMLQTFDSFGIDITEISEDQMRITLIPR